MSPVTTFLGPDNLKGIFALDVGYYGPCWVDITEDTWTVDGPAPTALLKFLAIVTAFIRSLGIEDKCRTGCAYVRIVDAGQPENYMAWHVDNENGGIRFATSVSTDDVPVNLAWPADPGLRDVTVTDTDWESAWQAPNGRIVMFTTELHGVIPQLPRPGEKTANFFATFYRNREAADLYQTNNTASSTHAALPDLERTRT